MFRKVIVSFLAALEFIFSVCVLFCLIYCKSSVLIIATAAIAAGARCVRCSAATAAECIQHAAIVGCIRHCFRGRRLMMTLSNCRLLHALM